MHIINIFFIYSKYHQCDSDYINTIPSFEQILPSQVVNAIDHVIVMLTNQRPNESITVDLIG